MAYGAIGGRVRFDHPARFQPTKQTYTQVKASHP